VTRRSPASASRSAGRRTSSAALGAVLLSVTLGACSTRAFFFHPNKIVTLAPDPSKCAVEDVRFRSSDGHMLRGWVLRPLSGTPTAVIVHLHGNGGNIGTQHRAVMPFVAAGFEAVVFDYRGYGGSDGEPSQEGVLDDALAAIAFARARPEAAGLPLVLFGQSLGGHLAIVAAVRSPVPVDAVVSEGAFTSHKDIAVASSRLPAFLTRLVVPDRYAALDVIDGLKVPILIIHSADDEQIPFAMGRQLHERARDPKRFWRVTGRHNAAIGLFPDEMVTQVRGLLELARATSR